MQSVLKSVEQFFVFWWHRLDIQVQFRLMVLWARFPILQSDSFHQISTGSLLILTMMFWGVPVLNAALAGLLFVAVFLGTANILERPGG